MSAMTMIAMMTWRRYPHMELPSCMLPWSQHERGAHGSHGVVSRDTRNVSYYNQHYVVSYLDLMGHIGYIPTVGEFGKGAVLII